jgi:hypothetical protein
MTERQWLEATSIYDMLDHLGERLSMRKRVLFGCAAARQVWPLVTKEGNRAAILTSERYADGKATQKEMRKTWAHLDWEPAMYVEWPVGILSAGLTYRSPPRTAAAQSRLSDFPQRRTTEQRQRDWADALREVVGNPFQEVSINPAWLAWNDRAVVGLARMIYRDQRWEDIPILADALEDAGCTGPLLDHLRRPGLHPRGCWAVDAVLGRE